MNSRVFREQKDTGGWAFPRDKEGVKIREGVGCCDGELVHRSGPSTRAVAHLSSHPLFPVLLLFFYSLFFSFLFSLFFFVLLLFMPTFVVHRPAHDSTRLDCLNAWGRAEMETRFSSCRWWRREIWKKFEFLRNVKCGNCSGQVLIKLSFLIGGGGYIGLGRVE